MGAFFCRGRSAVHLAVAPPWSFAKTPARMTLARRTILTVVWALGGALMAFGQIDPAKRELIQLGYNQPLEGHGPLAAYGFYFRNKPNFLQDSNLTLRLAVAPVYVDTELGISRAFGNHTDLGIGLAGGGFADSYNEVHLGDYIRSESFLGNGGEISSSLYHLFNPGSRIPLYGVVRGAAHYSAYSDEDKTASTFVLPQDQFKFFVRAGLRWGGREPLMLPALAMELSVWYEGAFRTQPGAYGFNDSFELNPASHLFWGRALFTYTLPESKHNFGVNLTLGTSLEADRFSAYRVGGNLPLYSEFPLSLPGYYLQELSARSFLLLGGTYNLPILGSQRWMLNLTATTSVMDYLPGLEQPGHWNSGVGGGIVYRSPTDSWQIALGYGYGINAIRDGNRGAQSLSIFLQFDLDRTRQRFLDPTAAVGQSQGLQQFFRTIFR